MVFKKLQDQKLALYCAQRTIRNWQIGKTWLWWKLWLAIKPNLKCTKFAQYKAEYENKVAIAEAHIGQAVADRKKVESAHDVLLAQKNELTLALKSGGSAVEDIINKANRIEAMALDVKKEFEEVNKRAAAEKEQREAIDQSKGNVNQEKSKLVQEVSSMEKKLSSAEQDRADKDDQIRSLREEMEHQNDMVSKLQKEKKDGSGGRQKIEEDIQAMEDRCNHLSRVKNKLEQSLDECEDSLDREKKSKQEVEKQKRKIEGDLKLTQETLADLDRIKAELGQAVQRNPGSVEEPGNYLLLTSLMIM